MKYILLLTIIFVLWSCWTQSDDTNKNNDTDSKKVEVLESTNLWWGSGIPENENWQR